MVYDYRTAQLTDAERRLCDFAVRLTLDPASMRQTHVDQLRSVGYSDEQISRATQVIGYFNYINRIADGLGVEPENWMTAPTLEEWERQRGSDYLLSLDADP